MGVLSRHKQELGKARKRYDRIGAVRCPYLGQAVTFHSDGFHHLRYNTHGSERSKEAQMHKFRLIPAAHTVISKSGTVQEY